MIMLHARSLATFEFQSASDREQLKWVGACLEREGARTLLFDNVFLDKFVVEYFSGS